MSINSHTNAKLPRPPRGTPPPPSSGIYTSIRDLSRPQTIQNDAAMFRQSFTNHATLPTAEEPSRSSTEDADMNSATDSQEEDDEEETTSEGFAPPLPFSTITIHVSAPVVIGGQHNTVHFTPSSYSSTIATSIMEALRSETMTSIPMIDEEGRPRPINLQIEAGVTVEGEGNYAGARQDDAGLYQRSKGTLHKGKAGNEKNYFNMPPAEARRVLMGEGNSSMAEDARNPFHHLTSQAAIDARTKLRPPKQTSPGLGTTTYKTWSEGHSSPDRALRGYPTRSRAPRRSRPIETACELGPDFIKDGDFIFRRPPKDLAPTFQPTVNLSSSAATAEQSQASIFSQDRRNIAHPATLSHDTIDSQVTPSHHGESSSSQSKRPRGRDGSASSPAQAKRPRRGEDMSGAAPQMEAPSGPQSKEEQDQRYRSIMDDTENSNR